MFRNKALKTAALLLGLIALGVGLGIYTARYYAAPAQAPSVEGFLWPHPKQIHAFDTVDHTGKPFGLERLKGHWSFLFFGYTHCPDICPVTLSVLDRVQQQLQQKGVDNVRTLFVTVDPERDTPERLAEYVHYFNPAFIGLGGSEARVQTLTAQIGIAASKQESSGDGDYLVNHSSAVFLVDPRGRLVGLFSTPHKAGEIVSRFLAIRQFLRQQS